MIELVLEVLTSIARRHISTDTAWLGLVQLGSLPVAVRFKSVPAGTKFAKLTVMLFPVETIKL